MNMENPLLHNKMTYNLFFDLLNDAVSGLKTDDEQYIVGITYEATHDSFSYKAYIWNPEDVEFSPSGELILKYSESTPVYISEVFTDWHNEITMTELITHVGVRLADLNDNPDKYLNQDSQQAA